MQTGWTCGGARCTPARGEPGTSGPCADAALLSDPDIRGGIASGGARAATAVLPVGSTEQHGPHLPVTVDTDIAREVARLVSEQNGYLLLPAVPYGVSHEHAPFFQASADPHVLRGVILDVCRSLYSCGVRDVVVVNGHHGNIGALGGLPVRDGKGQGQGGGETGEKGHDGSNGDGNYNDGGGYNDGNGDALPRIRVFHYWRYMGTELGHAGFAETSIMLAIAPGAVAMDRARRGLVTDGMPADEVQRLSELALRSFPEATGNGVWGDPTGATAQAGRLLLDKAASGISRACLER